VINLLMRYYDPQEGAVFIDGKDVRSFSGKELKTMFGVAFQNDVIFHDTIRENIRFGRDLSDEEILKAAKAAQAMEFIEEKGLDFMLAIRGMNLSGGQKQRLLIARALAGSPKILILDDSSSALDYATDARLRRAIHEQYSNVTTIIVAQRISSIMRADRILVLDEGVIIGDGTHAHLMETCETYREISESQMGGGSVGEEAES
jgi:ATP-binding cassette subfamily B protein